MDTAKLSIKLGALELIYEGNQDFIEDGLIDMIERLSSLEIPDVAPSPAALHTVSSEAGRTTQTSAQGPSSRLSTSDFAVKMGVKTGTDLAMAAAAYLHHTRGSEEFRRTDLLTAMKSAKAFYKASYGSNLSKSLETLTKGGRLQNPGTETYALPYAEIEASKRYL